MITDQEPSTLQGVLTQLERHDERVLSAEDQKRADEQKLKEESARMIQRLNDKNKESLRAGRGRLGYKIGLDDGEFFVLSEPVNRIEQEVNGNGDIFDSALRYYVLFTKRGIRAIRFNVNGYNSNRPTDNPNEGYYGDRYESGVTSFVHGLLEAQEAWEDGYGELKGYTQIHVNEGGTNADMYAFSKHPNPNFDYIRNERYKSKIPGFVVNEATGEESIRCTSVHELTDEMDGTGRFKRVTTNTGFHTTTGINEVVADVSENIVQEAFAASLENTKKRVELKTTPASAQLTILSSLESQLEAA